MKNSISIRKMLSDKTKELKETRKKLKKAIAASYDELELAKKVQLGLLPDSLPEITNLNIAATYLPTKKVGGDMYGLVQKKDNKTVIFIFDVSGHGVPSALICAMAKILFTNHIKRYEKPSEIFAAINSDICELLKTGHYLTAFLGIIDHSTHQITYSQAGHVQPVLYNYKKGTASFLTGSDVFLGHIALADIAKYHDNILTLDWNDKLLLYTDGLIETTDAKGDLYGEKRLLEKVVTFGKYSPDKLINEIVKDNINYRNNTMQDDDVTIFCVQIGCSEDILKISGFKIEDSPNIIALNSHDGIESICSGILRNLDKKGYTDKTIFEAHIAIHEILSNAIQHGNKFNPNKKVHMLYKIMLDHFTISVIDEGEGFDYRKLQDPTLPKNLKKEHGRGLFIVKEFMDSVKFNKKGNRVMINKLNK